MTLEWKSGSLSIWFFNSWHKVKRVFSFFWSCVSRRGTHVYQIFLSWIQNLWRRSWYNVVRLGRCSFFLSRLGLRTYQHPGTRFNTQKQISVIFFFTDHKSYRPKVTQYKNMWLELNVFSDYFGKCFKSTEFEEISYIPEDGCFSTP